jgi:hypothetical protein
MQLEGVDRRGHVIEEAVDRQHDGQDSVGVVSREREGYDGDRRHCNEYPPSRRQRERGSGEQYRGPSQRSSTVKRGREELEEGPPDRLRRY